MKPLCGLEASVCRRSIERPSRSRQDSGFLAGSFFPISAMPVGLTAIAKVLPVTHALALLRYGLVDRTGHGLHDIWGMTNTTAMAALNLAAVALFAVGVLALSIRVFTRAAID
jgi:ABC-type multidrug transport system permease subunit